MKAWALLFVDSIRACNQALVDHFALHLLKYMIQLIILIAMKVMLKPIQHENIVVPCQIFGNPRPM